MTAVNEIVELRPAYAWDCPECGIEHFERAVVVEMSQEQLRAIGEDYDCRTGRIQWMPEHVQCEDCGHIFETELFQ